MADEARKAGAAASQRAAAETAASKRDVASIKPILDRIAEEFASAASELGIKPMRPSNASRLTPAYWRVDLGGNVSMKVRRNGKWDLEYGMYNTRLDVADLAARSGASDEYAWRRMAQNTLNAMMKGRAK